jgi:peptidyl-prolyl cis-trans isomerase D
MAFIGTLRNKAGTWAAVFVFVAIAAFTLGDIFSGNSSILNWGRNSIGEIGGKDISTDEFQKVVNETEDIYRLQNRREPGDKEMDGLRQQAWDLLIARYAIAPEFEKVGSIVTDDEIVDMISGDNIDAGIRQAFTNPQTGVFDRSQLGAFLQKINDAPPGDPDRAQFDIYKKNLRPARERIKYENLLLKTNYVTKAEAEHLYHAQSDVAEVKYLYVPYFVISDSAAQVSDADYQDFYNKNKERFKTEETRDIKYVSVPVVPSERDTAAVREALNKSIADLKASTTPAKDSVLAEDANGVYQKFSVATIPPFINKDSLTVGKVMGPLLEGDVYRVVKVSSIGTDTVSSASARHILVKWIDESETSKKLAKEKAEKILKDIKAGANFAEQARLFSEDQSSAQTGGDVGWFSNNGSMVKPFETAVFGATKTGVVNEVVETQYGYHIIDVTGVKTNKAYNLAIIETQLIASDATINEAFRKAETVMTDVSGVEDFEAKAKEAGLPVLEAKGLKSGDRFINTLGQARTVIQWLYREAKVGKVSQVFEMDGRNVVAVMTGEIDKGYKPLDLVKTDITPEVKKIIKGRQIIEKVKGLHGTLEDMAKDFGPNANVYNTSELHLSSNGLPPSIGFDPVAVGTAFSLENGKRSAPVAGENGVVVIELQNKTVAPAIQDYSSYRSQLEQSNTQSGGFSISEAIKDHSNIEDKRYKFF